MLAFEILTFIAFGLVLGGIAAYFLRKREGKWTAEYFLVGAIAGLAGGLFGHLIAPGAEIDEVRGYNFVGLLFATVFAAGALFYDWSRRQRGRPGSSEPNTPLKTR